MTVRELGTIDLNEVAPYIARDFQIIGTLLQACFDAGLTLDDEIEWGEEAERGTITYGSKVVVKYTSCWRGRMGSINLDEERQVRPPVDLFKWNK